MKSYITKTTMAEQCSGNWMLPNVMRTVINLSSMGTCYGELYIAALRLYGVRTTACTAVAGSVTISLACEN